MRCAAALELNPYVGGHRWSAPREFFCASPNAYFARLCVKCGLQAVGCSSVSDACAGNSRFTRYAELGW